MTQETKSHRGDRSRTLHGTANIPYSSMVQRELRKDIRAGMYREPDSLRCAAVAFRYVSRSQIKSAFQKRNKQDRDQRVIEFVSFLP